MAHVSHTPLKEEQLESLANQLSDSLAKLNKSSTALFLDELLGTEEYIMLSKRLTAILMCVRGDSSYKIWNALKISPSTADRIRDNYRDGRYAYIEKTLLKNTIEYERICNTLEIIINCGMSPRGKGRWKKVTKLLTEK
ncbi:MAG: hypothetical protein K9M10_00145 [Candidatus Pacebacteria bacterium]|nr:hypothetical protein [Candidatus Paceibacterota bacterium]MCF7856876.1 hypothetical protein [Candidatus Paceibacterota bacterium]